MRRKLNEMNYIIKRVQSFKFAFHGIITLFKKTPNAKIHLAMAIAAVALGVALKISNFEWLVLIMVIGGVLAVEALNTAIEELCDLISMNQNKKIKIIKDLGAAAVLLSAISALIAGIVIFLPKIINFLFT